MDLRVQLIHDHEEGESISALSEIYGVARKTIYKWLERYDAAGVAGLADRSRAPQLTPHKLSEEVIAEIIAARQRWNWGPRKLRVKLVAAQPKIRWPAESTIGEVLKRAGLTHRRKPRVRTPPYGQPFASIDAANQTWCADFKGWFRTADGKRCDPLTLTDAHSRYLLRCQITPKADSIHVAAIFDAAFREYGLPLVIHTDNGVPFASCAPGGLSRVSMRWVKLGIVPQRSRPASPQDNGRHERMHSTLKQATLQPPERNARRQQAAFDRFVQPAHAVKDFRGFWIRGQPIEHVRCRDHKFNAVLSRDSRHIDSFAKRTRSVVDFRTRSRSSASTCTAPRTARTATASASSSSPLTVAPARA